jgi:hypothetical protein
MFMRVVMTAEPTFHRSCSRIDIPPLYLTHHHLTHYQVASKVTLSKGRVAIVFNQPVAPGGYLQVEFREVQMQKLSDGTLFYGVTGKRVGLQGEIPIGTARIQLPSRG